MQQTKHGLLLDAESAGVLIQCLDYRANQIKQKAKATGEDIRIHRGALARMATLRQQLSVISINSNGMEVQGRGATIEGEIESE